MMSHDSDNLFDQEIAQLLGSLEDSPRDSGAKEDSLDELRQLFDEISPPEPKSSSKERLTLSSLPSDAEIEDLFRDNDLGWDLDPGMITISELNFSEPATPVVSSGRDQDWDELESLLAPEPAPQTAQKITIVNPWLYEQLEELENLIAQSSLTPQKRLQDEPQLIAQLEALIDTPAQLPEIVTPVRHTEEDDEFKELEKFLEETNQVMGGSPGMAMVGSQRSPRPSKTFEQTMRVPIKHLDNLSNLIGELVVKRNRLEQDQERVRGFLDNLLNQVQNLSDLGDRMQDTYERTLLERSLLASRRRSRGDIPVKNHYNFGAAAEEHSVIAQGFDFEELDRFSDLDPLTVEMIELIVRVREAASDIQFVVDETDQVARSLRQVTTQLQEGMTKSRMTPFAQTTDRLPRAIREISLKLHKEVQLKVDGMDVLIDKMILEHLNSPMTHLVNNAITHGIERPEERQRAGKSPVGTINVRAFLQGNQTVIIVADDGAGIDPERVKRKAIEKRLITREEATVMNAQEVYELLFHPGFSTKDKADDFAGRGVGLDVVRTSLAEVRGTAIIDSVLGKGTTFTIRLPLTLSICKALCCLSNHARLAFSMDGVEDMKDFTPQDIKVNAEGQSSIPWYNTLLPLLPLSDLLYYNRQISRSSVYGSKPEGDVISVVILRSGNNLLAVQVDQVIGEQEIVIKQIEGPVPKPPGIAGATVLGDGSVMPIGDVLELIEIAQGRMRVDTANPWRKSASPNSDRLNKGESTVLIVDDSITVRELLSLSFSKAGYRVEQARDGQEAWEKLRSGLPCDIVFCDIEMPRMNGLELLSNLQKDEDLCNLPIALLTSRGAERHRKVAAKLGASGYFTKPYTEKDLLDAAARMMAGEILLPNSTKLVQRRSTEPDLNALSGAIISSEATITPSARTTPPCYLVLIIDDSVMVREMLSLSFTKAGYQIEQARHGQEAWEKLQKGLPCHLILCDIEMPRMNGLELLSRLQEDKTLSQIPVAMITSRGAQKMQNLAADMGAKGYFVKPYLEEVLLDAAQRLIAGEVLLEKNTTSE
jgi:chemosensory pili system protein ChpA (sensor histidine kinase/response regulator)